MVTAAPDGGLDIIQVIFISTALDTLTYTTN
jgi:hypothetical protein